MREEAHAGSNVKEPGRGGVHGLLIPNVLCLSYMPEHVIADAIRGIRCLSHRIASLEYGKGAPGRKLKMLTTAKQNNGIRTTTKPNLLLRGFIRCSGL